MVKVLNVLYQSDDNYAPQTGVSITSLFLNNTDIDDLTVYLLNDGISSKNLERFQQLGQEFNREIIFVNTEKIKQRLLELGVEPYKGTYTTYFKLLAFSQLNIVNSDRILQIDGDTIINASLSELLELDLDGYVCAATYDCIQNSYKQLIGLSDSDPYYNCGVLLINLNYWKDNSCEQQIINHLRNARNRYFTVDQDIINVLFSHQIKYLDIKYNLNSGFYVYGIRNSFYIYDLNPKLFATPSEIRNALANPIINHCMVPMTGRPWEEGNSHPQNDLYNHYLELSPWKDVPKRVVKPTKLFAIQRFLFSVLPLPVYCRIHKCILKYWLRRENQRCQEA